MDLIGHSLGRYHILEQLGEGGMAVVYKAYDTHLEHEMAVKVIRTDHLGPAILDRALKRFEREARSVARLNHPGIVSVVDYGEHEGSPYLVMPYLPGGTLKQYLRQHGRLTWQDASRLLLPVAEALGYAHQNNIVHRDVKPANILLTAQGKPMLTDFGVAKVLDEDVTQDLTGTAATVGTPEYMAPEQVMSKTVDHRADIYALGVVFYEMLIGRKPFEADTPMAVLVMHASAPLPRPRDLLPELPDQVERVLFKALQKNPVDRYQDMSEFVAALKKLLNTDVVAIPPTIRIDDISKPGAKPGPPGSAAQAQPAAGSHRVQEAILVTPPRSEVKRPSWFRFVLIGVAGVVLLTLLIIGLTNGWFGVKSAPVPTIVATLQQPTHTPLSPTVTSLPVVATNIPPNPTKAYTFGSTLVSPVDGMTMVYVPAGDFQMGSPDGMGDDDEHPQHAVYLDAYWIDKTEVTNGQYEKCVSVGGCTEPTRKDSYTRDSYYGNPAFVDYPVIFVNWNQAEEYCEWTGRQLPTEAQWEKAARGDEGRSYPWGDEFDCSRGNFDDATQLTAYSGEGEANCDGYIDTAPVANYENGASPYGALDMAGNVWEWVADWYGWYTTGSLSNPTGPVDGDNKVYRGGSWYYYVSSVRSANRSLVPADFTRYYLGFRCAVKADELTDSSEPPMGISNIEIQPTPIGSLGIDSTTVAPEEGMHMVYVPAGEFLMGSPTGDGDADEQPQHTVYLDDFWIDQTEVTNAMFAMFVEETNYLTDAEREGKSFALVGTEWLAVSGADWQHPLGPSSDLTSLEDHPVIHVSWSDAYAYCEWVGKRLPTEAEWEKAARGTDGATYPWGNASPAGNLVNYADANTSFEWSVRSVDDGYKYTSPVGNYPDGDSPYGALDMAGNVWEWVADWYGKDYYTRSPESNPTGPASGTIRVMRGGAWDDLISGIRAAYRAAYVQTNTNGDTGFRCASDEEVNP